MPQTRAIPGIEIAADPHDKSVDPVAAHEDLKSIVGQEAFMNEPVDVYVHVGNNPEDTTHFMLNVNGTNMPVIRGQVTRMKRKYLEVLARMKEVRYTQPPMDYRNPEAGNQLIPRTSQVYPFDVQHDPNPKGREWLRNILMEAA